MAKKDNQKIVTNDELLKLIKIVGIVCLVLVLFYFITVLVTGTGENDNTNEDTTAVIQYKKILVGEILNRTDSEYLVLVEKEDDAYVDLYTQYFTSYSEESGSLNYYTVDLGEVFNQNNVADETVVEGNDVQSYKFANTTLIKVKDGTLEGVYKDKDSIVSYLDSLMK